MRIVPASDSSIMVIFGDAITEESRRRVAQLFHDVRALDDSRIRNCHPAYASLLLDFDPLLISHDEITRLLEAFVGKTSNHVPSAPRRVDIPVCYDPELGLDLVSVAMQVGLSVDALVAAHSSEKYLVSFLGFSPGFAYLEGLPQELAVPRLATPRKRVESGSVGIAGVQTAVYPVTSPGGWQIIGRTATRMFDPDEDPPTALQLGDEVHFVPISRREYESSRISNHSEQPS